MTLVHNSPVTTTVINRQIDDLNDAWEELKQYPTKSNFMLMHNKLAILFMNMPVLQGIIEYDEQTRRSNNDNATFTENGNS